MPENTVLVSSLGLMGGSLAAALSKAGWRVLLHHRRAEVAYQAEELGYGKAVTDLAAGLAQADIAVICSPVSVIADTIRHVASLHERPVFTDVGSVKGSICLALNDLGQAGRYVGSHPMAGSHLQGLQHANADLYRNCITAITAFEQTPAPVTALIERMWKTVGARVKRFSAIEHDEAVARASHIPHIMAAATAALLDAGSAPLAATGFRDTTRVAGGSPELWTDILLHNATAMHTSINAVQQSLQELQRALMDKDAAKLCAWLERGRAGRQRFEQTTPFDVPTVAEEA
jgi:prephenate dehydrogenase